MKFPDDYQILTELHRSGDSTTYLARHLTLNRDVNLTVVRASGDRSHLQAFANDVELLKGQRHANVVPVIEGRWLDDDTYAIARARVRGSTLDQLSSAVGAMPAPRVAAALNEVTSALLWARAAGVTNRSISAESIVFQQGSGRALVEFEPSRLVADDVQTIREVARAMSGGNPVDISEYTAMLAPGATVPEPVATAPVGAASADAIPAVAIPVAAGSLATPRATTPVGDRAVAVPIARDDSVVVVKRSGMGFTGRVLTSFAVLAGLVLVAVFALGHRGSDVRRTAVITTDTTNDAAGDVALGTSGSSPAPDTHVYPTPTIVEPTPTPLPPQPQSYPYPYPTTSAPVVQPTQPVQPMPAQPMPTQPAPVRPAPDPVASQPRVPAVDTTTPRPSTGDVCDSPASGDQHQCLMSAIERSDRDLNAVYQRLISALRRQAGVSDDQPDPSSVEELRATQRRWLEDRDEVCRGTGSGLLYARERAACFADRSASRTRDLQAQLDNVP